MIARTADLGEEGVRAVVASVSAAAGKDGSQRFIGLAALAVAGAGLLLLAPVSSAGTAAGSLTIISAPAAATPMTSLTIRVRGLTAGAKTAVSFSNSSGFFVSDRPIRTTSKTVTVGVPLYTNATTGALGAGRVSVIVLQGVRRSQKRALLIRALPTATSYGEPLGEVSHAFLIFNALLLGQKLNQLEAEQALTGVDTSAQIAEIKDLLNQNLLARNDVDRIMANSSTTIPAGVNLKGLPLQFNTTSVEVMDSVLANYLLDVIPASVFAAPLLRAAHGTGAAASFPADIASRSNASGRLGLIVDAITSADSFNDLQKKLNTPATADNAVDQTVEVAGDQAGLMSTALKYLGNVAESDQTGLIAAGIAGGLAVEAWWNVVTDDYAYLTNLGVDPAAADAALAQQQQDVATFEKKLASAGCAGLVVGASAGEFSQLAGAAGEACQVALVGLGLIGDDPDNAMEGNQLQRSLAFSPVKTDPEVLATALNIPTSAANEGFALIDGAAKVTNSNGALSAQTSIGACCIGPQALTMDNLSDQSGNYVMLVPTGVPGTDYTHLTLFAYDAATDKTIGSEIVNLSGATPSHASTVPDIQGSCIDNDAASPDGDDPDCDSTG